MYYLPCRELRSSAFRRPDEASSIAMAEFDRHQIRAASEVNDVPRCPACRAPLVAGMTCAGPGFLCLCADAPFR